MEEAMKRADLKAAWTNGELKMCSQLKAQAERIYPNRAGWFKDDSLKAGLVFVYQGKKGRDYPLNENALNRVIEGKHSGKMREAWIINLRRGDNGEEFVDAAPAETVLAMFCSQKPMDGDWGRYWWLPEIISAEDDDDIPF
jgi:hypothetical protein